MPEPKKRPSADKTRGKILAAAQFLFAEHGFSAASISMIAKKAGINQSLIYHHFTNKELLWKAVKLALFGKTVAKNQLERIEKINELEPFIQAWAEMRFSLFENSPEALRLINWQLLEDENNKLTVWEHPYHDLWFKKIEQFQKNKQIPRSGSPDVIRMMLHQTINGLFIYPGFAKITPTERQQKLKTAIKVLLKGISENHPL